MCMLFVMQSFIEDSRCFDVQMHVFYVNLNLNLNSTFRLFINLNSKCIIHYTYV